MRPSYAPRTARGLTRRAILLAIALAVPAVWAAGTGSPAGPPAGPSPVAGSGRIVVAPAYVPPAAVEPMGPLSPRVPLSVAVALAPVDEGGLARAIALEYRPGSAQYRHYLTPAEIAGRFGASETEYASAVRYFRSFGLDVTASPDRLMLFVSGPSVGVARAFGTSFALYREGARSFYSHPTPALLPAGIPWAGALGLGNESALRPAIVPAAAPTGPRGLPGAVPAASLPCASSSWITPCLAHSAYNLTSSLAAGDNGTRVRVGIVDTYDANEPETQLASDLSGFATAFSLPYGNVSFDYPVPTSSNLNQTYTGWGIEAALDLEWMRAMAPGSSIHMTFAPDSNAGLYEAVDWLVAHDAVNVISLSWGENDVGDFNAYLGACRSACNASSDGSYETLHPVLEAAAAEGIGVFSASGDCGASDGTSGVSTDYSASDPYVSGVGATYLSLNASQG